MIRVKHIVIVVTDVIITIIVIITSVTRIAIIISIANIHTDLCRVLF